MIYINPVPNTGSRVMAPIWWKHPLSWMSTEMQQSFGYSLLALNRSGCMGNHSTTGAMIQYSTQIHLQNTQVIRRTTHCLFSGIIERRELQGPPLAELWSPTGCHGWGLTCHWIVASPWVETMCLIQGSGGTQTRRIRRPVIPWLMYITQHRGPRGTLEPHKLCPVG